MATKSYPPVSKSDLLHEQNTHIPEQRGREFVDPFFLGPLSLRNSKKEQFTMTHAIDWKSGLKLENSLTFLNNISSVPYKKVILR